MTNKQQTNKISNNNTVPTIQFLNEMHAIIAHSTWSRAPVFLGSMAGRRKREVSKYSVGSCTFCVGCIIVIRIIVYRLAVAQADCRSTQPSQTWALPQSVSNTGVGPRNDVAL